MQAHYLLTERQKRRLETLSADHRVVTNRPGELIVRRSDGRLARIKSNGRLVPIPPVKRVESYLQLWG